MKIFTTLLIVFISIYAVSGQATSGEISYKFGKEKNIIEYKKINDLSDFNTVKKKELPLFLFDSLNIKHIKTATYAVETLYLERIKLKNNDSIAKAIRAENDNIIKAQKTGY